MNRRTERIVKRITGIVLAAVLLSTTLIQHASAAEVVKISYISEISVGSKADLEANGFTVCSAASGTITLSTGQEITTSGISPSFTENDCIGYKTTLDRSKAITDVKIMHMNGGFEKIDMDSFVNENADGVSETIDIVFAALTEFRENYESGSKPAKIAYQTLNYMDVPQLDGSEDIPLGDYLLDASRTRDDIRDIILLADTAVVNYIKNQLILSVADDMSANTEGLELTDEEKQAPPDLAAIEAYTWLDRLVNNGTFEENITDPEELESTYIEYDKSYYQQTFSVINSVRNFAADYKAALERQGSLQEAAEKVAEEQEAAEKSGEETSATDVIEGRSEGNQAADDLNILVLYDYLDQRLEDGSPVYFYGKKADGSVRSFAEFLIEVGEMDPETEDQEARRLLYPLFIEQAGETPMTAGQWSILRISDLNTFLMSTVYEKVDYETIIENVNEQGNELLAANGTERLSIWYSVDYEFYKNGGEVYATSDTIRMQAASDKFDLLTKKSYKDNSLTDSQKAKNVIIGLGIAAASAFTLTQILFLFQKHAIAGALAKAATTGATTAMSTSSVIAGTCSGLATCLSVCMVVTAILIVCVLIAFLVFLFLRKEENEKKEEAKKITMLPIPEFLLDTRQTAEDTLVKLQYRAVCAPGTDTPQNLNRISSNTPWVVLYTTVDPDAGEPLSVTNQDGTERTPFVFTTNATQEVGKYCPMTMFEENAAGNLRGEAAANPVFAWFHRVDDAKSPKGFSEGKYVLKVELYSAGNATEARDQIRKKQGFTLIDYDLTPDVDGTYTYLGYSTTDNPDFALKDLRFAYNPGIDKKAGQVNYGDCVYSVYGSVGNLLLMGTQNDKAGSPILADGFKVTDTLGAVDPGYEPVNLFSGGPALDISSCGNWVAGTGMGEGNETQLLMNENEHVYLYFLPEVTYTGGTEYLGGLCFFGAMSGSGEKKNPGDGFVPAGWKRLSDTDVSGNQRGSMYLYYYPTYNPKRAITDVKYYQAEPNAPQVAYNIYYGSEGSYVAADVWQQGTRLIFDSGLDYASYTWLLRGTHSYRSNQFYEGGGFYESITADTMRKVDDGSNATMEYYRVTYTDGSSRIIGTNIRCTALYLGGPCQAKEPLKVGDIVARKTSSFDPATETPVRNFTDAYSATGVNLGYQGAGDIEWTVSWTDSIERAESVAHTYYTETMRLEKASNYSSLYLFIERKDPYSERGTLVKSVTVSYAGNDRNSSGSRSGYGAKYTNDGQTGYDTPYDTVCYDLFRNGPGQLIRKNLASGSSGGSTLTSEWDGWAIGSHTTGVTADQITKRDALSEIEDIKESQQKPCIEPDYSTEVAYLWVTYTSTTKDAISDLLIYETNMPDTAKTTMNFYVTSDAAAKQSATLCGEGWKPDPSGYTWCYLYAVKNNGHKVKELLVDEEPLTYQYKTVLTTDFKCSVSRQVFLKTKNIKNKTIAKDYIYNIAIGEGATKRDAMINLLDSACSEFIPFNTTTTEGRYGYLGYNTTTSTKKAFSGFLLYNTEYNETAKTLDYGYVHFDVLSGNLNPTVEGYAVYLFGTRDTLFNELYQTPTKNSKSRYVMQICCYPGKDLNDYALGKKKLEDIEDSTLREYTAFLIGDDDGDPVHWSAIDGVAQQTMSLNLGGEYLSNGADKRQDLYMYVHYSDDYYGTTNITDTASVFGKKSLPVLIGGGSAVLLAALAAILYKKRREQATGKEKV